MTKLEDLLTKDNMENVIISSDKNLEVSAKYRNVNNFNNAVKHISMFDESNILNYFTAIAICIFKNQYCINEYVPYAEKLLNKVIFI